MMRISTLILIAAILHYVGVAAYVFDCVPERYHSIYFYNVDRIYLGAVLLLVLWQLKRGISLIDSNRLKIALIGSAYQLIGYLIAVNIKFVTNKYCEYIWIIFFAFCFIVSLISFYYVSSSKLMAKR